MRAGIMVMRGREKMRLSILQCRKGAEYQERLYRKELFCYTGYAAVQPDEDGAAA